MFNVDSFKGKKALITGGTKGLGLATAKKLGGLGAEIYVSFRSDEVNASQALAELRKNSINCHAIQADLAEENGVERLFEGLMRHTDRLDIYIHNAAATAFKDLMELKAHQIDKTFNISIKSFILGLQKAVPMMTDGGTVVSVSGMDTLRAVPRHGLLGAAKSALETLSNYFAHELAAKKIRVNCINPGFFETESTRKYLGPYFESVKAQYAQLTPEGRSVDIEEISNVIAFLCSDYSSWIRGQTLCVDGGFDFTLPLSS